MERTIINTDPPGWDQGYGGTNEEKNPKRQLVRCFGGVPLPALPGRQRLGSELQGSGRRPEQQGLHGHELGDQQGQAQALPRPLLAGVRERPQRRDANLDLPEGLHQGIQQAQVRTQARGLRQRRHPGLPGQVPHRVRPQVQQRMSQV